MMRGETLSIESWLDPTYQVPDVIYLDVADWVGFVQWVQQDPINRAQKLKDKQWVVRLLRYQLNRLEGSDSERNKDLKDLVGIDLGTKKIRDVDEMFVREVLQAYFHNDPAARPQAELLAIARRQNQYGKIAVISQHRAYQRIPMVDTYFLDAQRLRGNDDLPPDFDFFIDMNIHSSILRAAATRIQNGDNPTAVVESVKEFFSYVRNIIGSTDDGYNLMLEAFSCQQWNRNQSVVPNIKLNSLASQSELNEQKGVRDIALGVASALRNPIAHQPVDQAFIQSRYQDKRSTLKTLCILSFLFDKVDKRIP